MVCEVGSEAIAPKTCTKIAAKGRGDFIGFPEFYMKSLHRLVSVDLLTHSLLLVCPLLFLPSPDREQFYEELPTYSPSTTIEP